MPTPTDHTGQPRAAILPFPRKRGRPKIPRTLNDTGTPELVMKRLQQQTIEALDLCLERGIITNEQHRCGVRLRWLYTVRYGVPGIRAIDPANFGGMEIKTDDPEWRAEREQEFADAMQALQEKGCASIVSDVCIYNERPKFLQPSKRISFRNTAGNERQALMLREGLAVLVALWQYS